MITPCHHPSMQEFHPIVTAWGTRAGTTSPEVIVEIGPGRGDFLFHLAQQHPTTHIIGIEIRHLRFCKLLSRRGSLQNVSVVWGDARIVLPQIAAAYRIRALYINFPDPWPKRRHAKHRLMQPAFIHRCIDALAMEGELWFTTDHQTYAEWTAAHFTDCAAVTSSFADRIVTHHPEAYPTYFAQKWTRDGRTIYYQRYQKK